MQHLKRILSMPKIAWDYSQRRPLEAFVYAAIVLLFAWGARLFLSIVAISMMAGAITKILNPEKSNH